MSNDPRRARLIRHTPGGDGSANDRPHAGTPLVGAFTDALTECESLHMVFDEAAADRALCLITSSDGVTLGTGFMASPDGVVLTCEHVIAGQTHVRLESSAGKRAVLSADAITPLPALDLALLRAPPTWAQTRCHWPVTSTRRCRTGPRDITTTVGRFAPRFRASGSQREPRSSPIPGTTSMAYWRFRRGTSRPGSAARRSSTLAGESSSPSSTRASRSPASQGSRCRWASRPSTPTRLRSCLRPAGETWCDAGRT